MQEFLQSIWNFIQSLPSPIAQGMVWGIMAIGVYLTYKILDVADLTVDGSMATGGAVLVMLVTQRQMNIYLAMLIAFAAGCAAGLTTGLLHTKLGIPAILAGILTQLGLYSINLRIMGGSALMSIPARNYAVILTSRTDMLGQTILKCGLFVVVIVGLLYWFFGTEMGHSIRATGCNLNMARANGINTDLRKIIGLTLSNGIVAIAGALLAQFQGNATVDMGRGAIVIGLAAVIIGEVIFGKLFNHFVLRLLSVVIGGIIYYIAITLVLRLHFSTNDLKLFTAILVAIFLAIPYLKSKYMPRRVAQSKEAE